MREIAGSALAECAARYGSGIREAAGIGLGRLVSVEKLRGSDFCLGYNNTEASYTCFDVPARVLVGIQVA